MKTFNGSQELKYQLLVQLKHHEELDAFVQGQWLTDEKVEGNGFKGCFYGCTMQTKEKPLEAFSEKYNVDLWYCYLTEKIFEGLPKEEAKLFPYQSIEVLPVDYDFNKVKSAFLKANLIKHKEWVSDENVLKAIDECITLFEVPFNEIARSAARSAESAARSAAWSAESAAKSAAWSAESAAWSAESAAWSAESAAWSAWSAWSAAESAAWSAESAARSAAESAESAARSAEKNHYVWMRDTLFNLIVDGNS